MKISIKLPVKLAKKKPMLRQIHPPLLPQTQAIHKMKFGMKNSWRNYERIEPDTHMDLTRLFVYSQAKYFEEQMATLFGSAGVDELPTPEQFNVGFQKMAGNC